MTASFTLTLDTTAPHVAWGAVTGATAGELLDVAYSSDEPLASASLQLADSRRLAMDITATDLTVLLPPDTPNGYGWITVTDDVGNAAPRQPIQITGVIVVPPPEPPSIPGGFPRPTPSAHPVQTRRGRSRATGRSNSRVRRGPARARSVATLDSRLSTLGSRKLRTAAQLRTSAQSTVSHKTESVLRNPYSRATVRRRDAPGEEDALFLAGLL